MQLGLAEVVFDRDHQIETGNGPDGDGFSETTSGINECVFDPFSGLNPLFSSHPGDGGSKGLTRDIGAPCQRMFDLGDISF